MSILGALFGAGSAVSAGINIGTAIKEASEGASTIIDAVKGQVSPEVALELERVKSMLKKLEIDDKGSARIREVEVRKLGLNITQNALAWINTLGFFGALALVVFKPITIDNTMRDILLILIGNLSSNYTNVNGYYFGSSSGSQIKNTLIEKLTGTGGTNAQ
jgi:hypothetical protein